MSEKTETVRGFLENLSPKDFLNVGVDQIAYIRMVEAPNKDSRPIYCSFAANGQKIAVYESYEAAVDSIRENELHPVTLH